MRIFRKYKKAVASTFLLIMVSEILAPINLYALTTGPAQPETKSFTPVGTSDMVDLFSGDFKYNIPLMDVGGYPINISYQAGITADQEASWVGLGWNLNIGAITRNVRGIPDDFRGDLIKKETDMKNNHTVGVTFMPNAEFLGIDADAIKAMKFSLGISNNSFNGYGFSMSASPSISLIDGDKGNLNLGLGLSAGSEGGVGIAPSLSYSKKIMDSEKKERGVAGLSVGFPYNSRSGLKGMTIDGSYTQTGNNPRGKDKDDDGSIKAGSTIGFTTGTYTPSIGLPMMNVNLSFKIKLGAELMATYPNGKLNGYYSGQYLYIKNKSVPAYGYLNAEYGNKNENVMHDFNREKDGAFTENTIALAIPNQTYDVYSVAGQGIGGSYRPFRSDVGIVYDSETNNFTAGLSFPGVESGVGNLAKMGMNMSINAVGSRSGYWKKDNKLQNILNFKNKVTEHIDYEPYYFKQAGDQSADNDIELFNHFGAFDPVSAKISESTRTVEANLVNDKNGYQTSITRNTRAGRQFRNETVQAYTANQAKVSSHLPKIPVYKKNEFTHSTKKNEYSKEYTLERTRYGNHHLSEMVSYRADGARYVFGIPAYNTIQKEVTYNIEGEVDLLGNRVLPTNTDINKGLTSETEVDYKNKYIDKTTTPPFVHSFLLTEVLSADYVDVTGDGPSEDDLGSYTKFNYSRISNYKWRTPYAMNNLNPALENEQPYGNKASYVYGEKEIWYVHSIETKTHVAEFTLKDRLDGLPVNQEESSSLDNRTTTSTKLQYLSQIKLYSKKERFLANGQINDAAVAIKTITFDYDYSLCDNILNHKSTIITDENTVEDVLEQSSGKLTLRKITITHGNSTKGSLNPYEFFYENTNPGYSLRGNDRWGNYSGDAVVGTALRTYEYPYTNQDKNTTDENVAAWTLSKIILPSQGVIKVEYESDDYAYVQDKRAMQMFIIDGFSYDKPSNIDNIKPATSNELYSYGGVLNNKFLYFKLKKPISSIDVASAKSIFEQQYLKEQKNDREILPFLYFKYCFKIKKETDIAYKEEFVPGYLRKNEIKTWGVCRGNGTQEGLWDYGYLEINPILVDDPIPMGNANPFAHAAWNYIKLNLPRVAFSQPTSGDIPVVGAAKALLSTYKQIYQTVTGYNSFMRTLNIANTVNTGKSFIRLFSPEKKKLGGGHRVKKIQISDFVENPEDEFPVATYGQEYKYTTTDQYGNEISSGVCSYEPNIGGEENALKQPMARKPSRLKIPSGDYVTETPFGESFYPSASVGYSKVTVSNIKYENVRRNATGKVVHEFYTAKDFPTRVQRTNLQTYRNKGNPVFRFMSISAIDELVASQGFLIELNDMHGKKKSEKVYNEFDPIHPISGVDYKYAVNEQDPSRLSNLVHTVDELGRINKNKELIGFDYDITVDCRDQKSQSVSGGFSGNLDNFLAAIVPVAIPIILPDFSQERTGFRSAVITKVINLYGVLTETTAFDDKSTIKTENVLWDRTTGEVLLTKTTNVHKDPVYTFTYPAHWVYPSMGHAYKNTGIEMSVSQVLTNLNHFTVGDEVMIDGTRYWVDKITPTISLINKRGYSMLLVDLASEELITIVRSGRRNMQSTPIGMVSSLSNPMVSLNSEFYKLHFEKVISASATEFSDKGNLFCECNNVKNKVYNPFIVGTTGNWRPRREFTFLSDRTQSDLNGNVNTRKDGVISNFEPFWNVNGNGWGINANYWTYVSEATLYSPYGYSLEEKDALGRYSAALYGYNHQLPIATGANTQYREIGFDNFEDYSYYDCTNFDRHFSYKRSLNDLGENNFTNLTNQKSHSGNYSIRIKNVDNTPTPKKITVTKIIEPCPQ